MLKKMGSTCIISKEAGRRKHLAAVFVCLHILLFFCIGGFFYLNLHSTFLKEKEPRIFGAVFPDTADGYYREILTQIETSIRAEGDLLLSRDCGYDIELQGRQMLELAGRGAEAIFVCASAEEGLEQEIRECVQRGTRVIMVGRSCHGAEHAYALVTSDDEKAGETLAGYIDVEVKEARILLLGRENDASSQARIESFSSTISGDGFEIVRRVQVEDGKKEMEMARNDMIGELQSGRDFDLVFAADEKLAAGAYAALKEAGEEKNVRIVAVDGSPVGKRMLRSSKYLATVMEYPSVLAAEAVGQAYKEQGQKVGGRILTQVKLVTKNIIYSYDIDKWE